MTNAQARQFVSALFIEIFERYDRTKLDKFFSKDVTGFLLYNPADYDSIVAWLDRLETSYPTLEAMVHRVLVEGLEIAAVVNLTLTAPDQKKVYVSIAIFMELSSKGKIIKWRTFSNS